jgi:hypothetical protein
VIKKDSAAYLLIFFCALYIGCESLSPDAIIEDYPVFIERMEFSDLQALNDVYHQKNDNLICSTLNEYGLTGFSRVLFSNDINPCLNRSEVKKELTYSDGLLELAKQTLVDNSEFTGVLNKEDLILESSISLNGCTICEGDINNVPLQWKFTFQPQLINGIEVDDTNILVYVDVNGVNRIWGNWYPVVDPGFVEFGSSDALDSVLGLKVRYSNAMNQIFEQEIATEHISGQPELRYSTVKVEKGLEIHKVWIIKVMQENTTQVRWNILISTVDGQILESKLL